MDKIEELLKKLRGDPERCAKCAEDMDYDCPYAGDPDGCNSPTHGRFPVRTDEIADALEKEIESFHFRYRAKLERLKQAIEKCHIEADSILGVLPDEQTDAIHYASEIYELTDEALGKADWDEIGDFEWRELKDRMRRQRKFADWVLEYANVKMSKGDKDTWLKNLAEEAEEILDEQEY